MTKNISLMTKSKVENPKLSLHDSLTLRHCSLRAHFPTFPDSFHCVRVCSKHSKVYVHQKVVSSGISLSVVVQAGSNFDRG